MEEPTEKPTGKPRRQRARKATTKDKLEEGYNAIGTATRGRAATDHHHVRGKPVEKPQVVKGRKSRRV